MTSRDPHLLQQLHGLCPGAFLPRFSDEPEASRSDGADGKNRIQGAARILENDADFPAANPFPIARFQGAQVRSLEQNFTRFNPDLPIGQSQHRLSESRFSAARFAYQRQRLPLRNLQRGIADRADYVRGSLIGNRQMPYFQEGIIANFVPLLRGRVEAEFFPPELLRPLSPMGIRGLQVPIPASAPNKAGSP